MDPLERNAEQLAGAVWGHLVGDAVGVPYEFLDPAAIEEVAFRGGGLHGQPAGTWSDDGALMLALLDSLVEEGPVTDGPTAAPARPARGVPAAHFDVEDQGRRILAWHERGAYTPDGEGPFDVGSATRAAIEALQAGVPAARAGSTRPGSLGNGSLMRILPVALAGRGADDATLVAWASAASAVTHGEPLPRTACALYVLIASRLLARPDDPGDAFDGALSALREVAPAAGLEGGLAALTAWRPRTGSGHVADAFWSAWEAFAGATSYRETVERAVRLGHDTDTTAAIAGGLAGIRWGISGIPPAWLAGMRGRDVVGPLLDRLLGRHGWRTSTTNPLRVDWVDLAGVETLAAGGGALGMTLLPGKRRNGYSGPQWRDAVADAARLRDRHGATALLLLVEDVDLEMSRAHETVPALEAAGVPVIRHPVRDMDVPADPVAYRATLDGIRARVAAGERIVVACRGGLGRTGTAVACLLVDARVPPEEAIARVRASRPGTIERREQEDFVRAWVRVEGEG
jgi:ADP-ribosylglycohydrolase